MLPRSRPTHAPPSTVATKGSETEDAWVRPLESHVAPMTHVRGTLLVASRDQIPGGGRIRPVRRGAGRGGEGQLASLIAASWVPVELAAAHFAAIDRLELPLQVIEKATGTVAAKLQGSVLRTVAKAAQASGATPLSVVRALGMLWGRTFRGGAVGVKQTGPKEGTVYVVASPLLASRYHRTGLRVHVQAASDLFSHRAVVREIAYKPAAQELTLRVQWV